MKHLSLFNGIGGFQLAAEWVGWENTASVEIDPFCNKITKYHFPKCKQYEDIKEFDGKPYRGIIDIISGGFPCQPYSQAGKRLGKADERHLWPEMLRIIREVQPCYVVGENVRGITNWNGGMVFDEVQADLEAEGYEVLPFLLPACAVNAPHRRDRIWFIAHLQSTGTREDIGGIWSEPNGYSEGVQNVADTESGGQGRLRNEKETAGTRKSNELFGSECGISDSTRTSINSNGIGQRGQSDGIGKPRQFNEKSEIGNWENFPTFSPLRLRDDGVSRKLVRFVKKEFYATITEENRIKDLPEMCQRVSTPEIWEQIRGLYSLEHPEVLLQTMQLYSEGYNGQVELSPFSEDFYKPIMQTLRKYGQFGCTPSGRELQKKREREYPNSLSFLPHEIALAAKAFEKALIRFDGWHRNESIKGYGNAIVPQVAFEIFKAINLTH